MVGRKFLTGACVFIAFCICVLNCSYAGETWFPSDDEWQSRCREIASVVRRRCFDRAERMIHEAIADVSDKRDFYWQLLLVDELTKLGPGGIDESIRLLESWDGKFSGMNEYMRLMQLGSALLRLRAKPEQAVECFEKALDSSVAQFAFPVKLRAIHALFDAYANSRELFKVEKLKTCLDLYDDPGYDKPDRDTIIFYGDKAIYDAASGNAAATVKTVAYLDEIAAEGGRGEAIRFYYAPVWGWLGDVDKVVEILESNLAAMARTRSKETFRLECEYLRESPAYDSMREDERFTAMWERLSALEPAVECEAPDTVEQILR